METPVVDFHCHVGGWDARGRDDSPDMYLRVMDAAGVDISCINCILHSDARRGNDYVARYMERAPERFAGVAYVTPMYPDEAISELERCFDSLGFKFLKIYPSYIRRPVDDPVYDPIYDWCNDRGAVIMSHSEVGGEKPSSADDTAPTTPRRFVGLAERYPRIRWVLAHAGRLPPGRVLSVQAAQARPNIYLETCSSGADAGTIEYMVEHAGAHRVLYGSDMPLMDSRFQVARIATADIPDEAKRQVLGLNAIRLLGLDIS